jgi:hypothetical protein
MNGMEVKSMLSSVALRKRRSLSLVLCGAFFSCALSHAAGFTDGIAAQTLPAGERMMLADVQGLYLKLDLGLAMLEDDCAGEESTAVQPLAALTAQRTTAPFDASRAAPEKNLGPTFGTAPKGQSQPVATAQMETAVPQATARTWQIFITDKTLNAALARWAESAGWQLLWELPVDYAIDANTTLTGTLEEVVGTVVRSMSTAEIPMKAIFYDGNKVLRIVAKGTE